MGLRSLAAALALFVPLTALAEAPSVAAFFANPRFASPSLSPSGRRAAVLVAQGDTHILLVRAVRDSRWTPITRLAVHGCLLEANRQRWYEALAAFFDRNLAARAPES